MSTKWTPPDADDLRRRYLSGESVKALAQQLGVSRGPIARALSDAGVDLRGRSGAMSVRMSRTSASERARLSSAAHDAVRGSSKTPEQLARMAIGRYRSGRVTSPAEMLMREWIGGDPQYPVGPYNIDIALSHVAVEIFGGNWHAHGRHAERLPKRARYILDQGWLLVIVWVTGLHPLTRACADQVLALNELAQCNPSARGQYRVIRGTGEDATSFYPDVDHLARVPPVERRPDARP